MKQADENSIVQARIDTGWYDILVETEFGYPHTFDSIHIQSDTSLILPYSIRFRDPDTVVAVYTYGNGIRKLPDGAYRKVLAIISQRYGDLVDCSDIYSWPKAEIFVGDKTFIQYTLIRSPHVAMWEAHDAFFGWAADFDDILLYAGAIGFRSCPEDSIQLESPILPPFGN